MRISCVDPPSLCVILMEKARWQTIPFIYFIMINVSYSVLCIWHFDFSVTLRLLWLFASFILKTAFIT